MLSVVVFIAFVLVAILISVWEVKVGILDPILEKVEKIETWGDSLIASYKELAALLLANAADPAKVAEIANRMDAQAEEMKAAVEAGTTAPPPPPIEG